MSAENTELRPAVGSKRVSWYSLATVLVAAGTSALAWISAPDTAWITTVALLGVVVVQLLLGRWLFSDQAPRALSVAFTVWLGVMLAVACLGTPQAAVFQFIAYPLVWMATKNFRQSLLGSTFVAFGVGVGSAPTTGWLVAVLASGLALVFAVGIGAWISHWIRLARERAELITQLRATQESARALQWQAGQQAERARFAREIHDTITQNLTGIVMAAQRVRRRGGDADVVEQCSVIENLATAALADARTLVSGESPTGPGDLAATMHRLAADFERETSITVTVSTDLGEPLGIETGVVLLRCAQESLANIRNHAQARNVLIALTSTPQSASLSISDDGIGIEASGDPGPGRGHGIANMRERVSLAGGTFGVEDAAPGTIVRVSLPADEPDRVG